MLNQIALGASKASQNSCHFQKKIARGITNITAPPLLAIPCFIYLGLNDPRNFSSSEKLILSLVVAVIFGATLPIILVIAMFLLKKINDIHITTREQRYLPFLLSILSFVTGTILLWLISGAGWLTAILLSYTLNTLVVMLINYRWKISIHATSIGGILAAFTILGGWMASPLLSIVGLVTWARVYLKAHTAGQVLAGSLLGFFFTLFQLVFFFKL